MALRPGSPIEKDGAWVLDDHALASASGLKNSMALEMEEQMMDIYEKIKGDPMSKEDIEGLRMLLVVIARGVLIYLGENDHSFTTESAGTGAAAHSHKALLTIEKGSLP